MTGGQETERLTGVACAVVVEKPFTPSHKEAEELIALAREKGRILTVYQSRFPGPFPSYRMHKSWVLIQSLSVTVSRPPLGLGLPNPLPTRTEWQSRSDRRVRDAFRPLPPCDSGGR